MEEMILFLSRKEEHNISNNDFEYFARTYLKLVLLKGFLDSYYQIENYYKPRVLLLLYIVYLFGWFYIIIVNLYDLF